jgi:serine-protein kinase ATM
MDSLTLHDICSKLTSSQIKSRQLGLSELQRLLVPDNVAIRDRILDEDAYAALLQALSSNFILELASFRKSNSAQAATILRMSTECFQSTLETANVLLTRNSLRLAINHLLNCLPSRSQAEFKLVAPSFFACLRIIASHPPHIEQLKRDKWKEVIQVCLSNAEVRNLHDFGKQGSRGLEETLTEEDFGSLERLPMRKEVADLMFCVLSFCLFPGAPFHGNEEELLTFLFDFLATYGTASDARTSAVIALNRLLQYTAINNVGLATETSLAVLRLYPDIWDTRVHEFKKHVLLTLAIVFPYLRKCFGEVGMSASAYRRSVSILDLLKKDAQSQDHRSSLQLVDLQFARLSEHSDLWKLRPNQSFIGPFFSLLSTSPQAEIAWLSLQIQSSLIHLLDTSPEPIEPDSTLEAQARVKRRRLSPNRHYSNVVGELFDIKTQGRKVYGLQILASYLNSFHTPSKSLDFLTLIQELDRLGDDPNPEIVGWSLVCILGALGAYCKVCPTPNEDMRPIWTKIWNTSSKHAALPSTCRPACALMEGILQSNVLDVPAILPYIRGIFDYVELRGPGGFNDKACDFWNILLLKLQHGGIPVKIYRESTLKRWIEFRWGKCDVEEIPSQGEGLVTLPLSCLCLFGDIGTTSNEIHQLTKDDSRPHSSIWHTLSTTLSQLRLINFLLNDEIYVETERTTHKDTPSTLCLNPSSEVEAIMIEKSSAICAKLEAHEAHGSIAQSITVEELGWFTSISILTLFLVSISPIPHF